MCSRESERGVRRKEEKGEGEEERERRREREIEGWGKERHGEIIQSHRHLLALLYIPSFYDLISCFRSH